MNKKFKNISAFTILLCYNVLKKRGELLLKNFKSVKIYIGDEFYNEYKLNKIIDNRFEYKDDSCLNIIEFTEENVKLIRENDEFLLIINSNAEEASYTLKELNYELDIKINYFDQIKEGNNLMLCYQLETNDKAIKLILEGE